MFYPRFSDQDLLSAAAWYQEGLTETICVEYLLRTEQSIGSFLIRRNYDHWNHPFILSVKTNPTSIEHYIIQRTMHDDAYQIQVCSMKNILRLIDRFIVGLDEEISQFKCISYSSYSHARNTSCPIGITACIFINIE